MATIVSAVFVGCSPELVRELSAEAIGPEELPDRIERLEIDPSGVLIGNVRCGIRAGGEFEWTAEIDNPLELELQGVMNVNLDTTIVDFIAVQIPPGRGEFRLASTSLTEAGQNERLINALRSSSIGTTNCAVAFIQLSGPDDSTPVSVVAPIDISLVEDLETVSS